MSLGLGIRAVTKAYQLISKKYAKASDVTKVGAYLKHVKKIREQGGTMPGKLTDQTRGSFLSPLWDNPETIALRRLAYEVPVRDSKMAKSLGYANSKALSNAIKTGDEQIKSRGYSNFVRTKDIEEGTLRKGGFKAGVFDKLSEVPVKIRNKNMREVYEELAGKDFNLKEVLKNLKIDGKSVNLNDAAKVLGVEREKLRQVIKGLQKKNPKIAKGTEKIGGGPFASKKINLYSLCMSTGRFQSV